MAQLDMVGMNLKLTAVEMGQLSQSAMLLKIWRGFCEKARKRQTVKLPLVSGWCFELGPTGSNTQIWEARLTKCNTNENSSNSLDNMTDDLRNGSTIPLLQVISLSSQLQFETPSKRINDGDDLSFFLRSSAYADIMTWLLQLNRSMIPQRRPDDASVVDTWLLKSADINLSPHVAKLSDLVRSLDALMDEAPPESGPRRFGNAAFRKWHRAVQEATPSLLREALSDKVWGRAQGDAELNSLNDEVAAYLLGSFGSPERLDYGTGHELSFLAFLACIWKLGGFSDAESGTEERGIVTAIIQP